MSIVTAIKSYFAPLTLSAKEIREDNRMTCAEVNRLTTAQRLKEENDYWLKVYREEPERRIEALDELDRLRVISRAS